MSEIEIGGRVFRVGATYLPGRPDRIVGDKPRTLTGFRPAGRYGDISMLNDLVVLDDSGLYDSGLFARWAGEELS